MDEQLYLFEALIESIYFEDSVTEIPQKKQIVVSVKLGDVVTLEIRSETLPQTGEGPRKRHVDFRSGKSYLCMLTVEKLLETLQKHPLDIAVGIRGDVKPIGSSNTPWDDSFKEMVLLTKDNTEFVSPTTIIDNYCLLENGMIKGNVQMLLRISCFGKSIQTHFEVLQESMNKQFLFKISNMGTTFACSRYGTGTSNDFIPVSAIYNSINFKSDQEKPTGAKPLSWTALMEDRKIRSERSSVQSEFLFPEYLNIIAPLRESAMTFDIISIQMRPEEDRFIDFMTGKKLGEKNDSLHSLSLYDDGEGRIIFFADERNRGVERKSIPETTNSKACQCPKRLSICKHVLGAIERYQRSHPDLKIQGKHVNYEKILTNAVNEQNENGTRLRAGMDEDTDAKYVKKKGRRCYNLFCPMKRKLRTVGITELPDSSITINKNKSDDFCEDFFCPESTRRNITFQAKYPEDEKTFTFACQDKYCPAAKLYKRMGLGPLAIGKCQGTLYGPVKTPVQYGLSQTYGTFDTYGPYGIFSKTDTSFLPPNAMNLEDVPVLRLKGGGGGGEGILNVTKFMETLRMRAGTYSKSPVAECQEIMEQFDQLLQEYRTALEPRFTNQQKQHMNATSNNNYIMNPYTSGTPMTPIHWDCPNPLPFGLCENLNCPYVPEDLEKINRAIISSQQKNKTNKGPPHNTSRCNQFSYNPFYDSQQIVNMMQIGNAICSNPNCDFTEQSMVSSCSNPDCPFGHIDSASICSNPDCPLFNKIDSFEACSNPDCPFLKKVDSEICSNPECPFAGNKVSTPCTNLEIPISQKCDSKPCSNPDCPLKQQPEAFSTKNDENAECTFFDNQGNICQTTSKGECMNPECPFRPQTCSNTECPFNIKKEEICENPKCPYKSDPSAKQRGICGPRSQSICGDATCPFQDQIDNNATTEIARVIEQKKDDTIEEGLLVITQGDKPSHYDFAPCTLSTCKFMGAKLKCDDCGALMKGKRVGPCPKICPGDVKCPLALNVKKKKKSKRATLTIAEKNKERRKFSYQFGDDYPGNIVGHRECVIEQLNVPQRMGWLWNVHTPCLRLKPRRGWKPGSLGKTILEKIQAHRASQGMAPLEVGKKRRRRRYGGNNESDTEVIQPKPTLQIQRKEGVYFITMNPLKDPRTLVPTENPYMECTPLQFRIMKNKEVDKTCLCTDKGVVCSDDNASTDSELDIEFTTPAGLIRPERFARPKNVIHIDTQYNAQDCVVPVTGRKSGKDNKKKSKFGEKEDSKDYEKEKDKNKNNDDSKKKKGK